jgi:hypothetical protein
MRNRLKKLDLYGRQCPSTFLLIAYQYNKQNICAYHRFSSREMQGEWSLERLIFYGVPNIVSKVTGVFPYIQQDRRFD